MQGKIYRIMLLFCSLAWIISVNVWAEEDMLKQQTQESGAAYLTQALPEETQQLLIDNGVDLSDMTSYSSLQLNEVGASLWKQIKEQFHSPAKSLAKILAVILMCSLIQIFEKDVGDTVRTVGVLFIGLTVALPISDCIETAAEIIRWVGMFILACTPVMAGVLLASGHPAAASAHSFWMLGAGDVISLVASVFVAPILQVLLMLSLVSSLSPRIRMKGFCQAFYNALKWIMGFSMTVFSAVLGIQSVFTSNADAVSLRAAKFAVANFVPIVGSALADALASVQGSLKALSSGVGAFGVLGTLLVTAPILLRCFSWYLVCFFGEAAAGLMGAQEITDILKGTKKCVEMMMLLLICCLVLMAISSATVLVGGRNG